MRLLANPAATRHLLRLGPLGFACLLSCAGAARPEPVAAAAPKPVETRTVKLVKVYRGPEGLKVTLVRFAPPDGDAALLQVSGTEDEIDGMVLAHQFATGPDHYETVVHGRPYWTFRRTRGDSWEVWHSGAAHPVTYDEAASTAAAGDGLIALHHAQAASGALAALQRFNREERIAAHDRELADSAARVAEECGFAVPAAIEWDTIDDELLGDLSIASWCGSPASALRDLCRRDSSYRDLLATRVKAIRCRYGDESRLELTDAGVLLWRFHRKGVNLDELARGQLLYAIVDNPLVLRGGGGHLLIADPLSLVEGRPGDAKLYFGDATAVFEQRPVPGRSFSGGRLWEPRVDHDTAIELRQGQWTLKCGDRSVALSAVSGAESEQLLASVKREPASWKRQPLLLARDTHGRYYYVDHLVAGGKGYRVFRGAKGEMKLTRLVNIVEDAQGRIFATKDGRLRLIVDASGQQKAWWMSGNSKTDLTIVPIDDSQKFIYNELGVYDGERLGTPCDHY